MYFPPFVFPSISPGAFAPGVPGKTKTLRSANLHSVRIIFHLTKNGRKQIQQRHPLTNKGEMSYNIPCGYGWMPLYRCGFHLCRLAGAPTPVSRRIFVFRVDYTTEFLVMQATFPELLEKYRLEGIFLPACFYTSMVLASRRWDCVYRMMLSPSLRTRSPLGIRTFPFRRTMTMMVWREMSSSRMGRPFQGF